MIGRADNVAPLCRWEVTRGGCRVASLGVWRVRWGAWGGLNGPQWRLEKFKADCSGFEHWGSFRNALIPLALMYAHCVHPPHAGMRESRWLECAANTPDDRSGT